MELGTLAVEPEQSDIVDIVQNVIKEFEPRIVERRLDIAQNIPSEHIEAMVDPKLFRIVMQNLIFNAIKYTPDEGRISLLMERQESGYRIEVSDTGIGIPSSDKAQVFRKLFRADNARQLDAEGTGLGLYIVKNIMENSGGKVWFESEENKGTTFIVTFPIEGMKARKGVKTLG